MNKIENNDSEWQLSPTLIHLNHAAVGPWPTRTKLAIQAFAEENSEFGSLNYLKWVKVESALRQQLALLINAESSNEISLLKNTSEALSVIAYGIDWQQGDNIVISDQEFPSNYIVWESLKSKGVEVRYANLSNDNPENSLIALCDKKTRLLSISSVQYSTGLRMHLEILGDYCSKNNILYCVDAIQSIGALPLDVKSCQADFVVADGHKWMLGPEGVALFYCRQSKRESLQLNQYGWHMVEDYLNFDTKQWKTANNGRRFECGSPNMLGIHGLHASLSLILEIGIDNIHNLIQEKLNLIITKLEQLPDINIISPDNTSRRSGIITFKSNSIETETLFSQLDKNGIFCAKRGGGIRLSPHYYTPDSKIEVALKIIENLHLR